MHRRKMPAKEYAAKRSNRRRSWQGLVMVMACIVVFCTTYSLILPAITLEKGKKLTCTYEVHAHTDGCFNENGDLTCGKADFVVHTHDTYCYAEDETTLVCTLKEQAIHEHTGDCYESVPHEHNDSCYTEVRGEQTCELEESDGHTHTASCHPLTCELAESEGHSHGTTCYSEAPTCGQEVTEGHSHSETCYDENGELACNQAEVPAHTHTQDCYQLICDKEVSEGHAHSDGCYDQTADVVCALEEAPSHKHTDECYEMASSLICEKTEADLEQKLTCTRKEVILHSHSTDCYDTDGNLVCGKPEILEHQHDDSCCIEQALVELEAEADGVFASAVLCVDAMPMDQQIAAFAMAIDEDGAENTTAATIVGGTAGDYTMSVQSIEAQDGWNTLVKNAATGSVRRIHYYLVTFEGDNINEAEVTLNFNPTLTSAGANYAQWQIFEMGTEATQLTASTETVDIGNLSAMTFTIDGSTTVAVSAIVPEETTPPASSFSPCGSSCTLDDVLVWKSSTMTNPFGGALDYNLFLFGDLENWNDIEGNAAIQGDMTVKNGGITYNIGATNTSTGEPIPHFSVGLLFGGTFAKGLSGMTVLNGSVVASKEMIAGNNAYTYWGPRVNTGDHYHGEDYEDIQNYFNTAKADLISRNASIYDMSQTDGAQVTKDESDSITLTGTNQFMNVFTLSAADYAAAKDESGNAIARNVYLDVPYGSYVIINVQGDGDNVINSFAPQLWTKNSSGAWVDPSDNSNDDHAQSQRILFNFDPSVTQVNLDVGFYLYGSVLAPNMHWNVDGVYVGVDGTAALGSADGNGTASEFHYNPYIPSGSASLQKSVICDTVDCKADHTLPENTYVRLVLEEMVNKTGHHATYTLEIPVSPEGTSMPYPAPAVVPGEYLVTEALFFTKSTDAEGNIVEIPVEIPGHSFSNVTFTVNGENEDTADIVSGGHVDIGATNHFVSGDKTTLAVRKKWADMEGKDMLAPAGVKLKVQLYRATDKTDLSQAEPLGEAVELVASDLWYHKWSNLDRYVLDENGEPTETLYYYFVREVGFTDANGTESTSLQGYLVEYDEAKTSGTYSITNRQATAHKVEKKWADSNGNAITPPEGVEITVTLYGKAGEGDPYEVKTNSIGDPIVNPIVLSAETGWEYYWNGLPELEGDEKIIYFVEETGCPEKFTAEITQNETGTVFTITNKKTPVWNVTVNKSWKHADGNSISGIAPVQVQLQRNGTDYGKAIWLDETNGWTYIWNDLPREEGSDGSEYTVAETSGAAGFNASYSRDVDSDNSTITLTVTNTGTETTGVTVVKQWRDANNNPTTAPNGTEIDVQLYRITGTKTPGEYYTVTLTFPGLGTKEYKVKQGSRFSYSINFNPTPQVTEKSELFKTSPNSCQVQAHWDSFYVTASDTIDAVSSNISITYEQNETVWGGTMLTIAVNNISVDYDAPKDDLEWSTTGTEYDPPVTLSGPDWTYTWDNLPAEDASAAYAYYVQEVNPPSGYWQTYFVDGKTYIVKPGVESDTITSGITEGYLTIINTSESVPGVVLPNTGGLGTGALAAAAASLIFGSSAALLGSKRRKKPSRK